MGQKLTQNTRTCELTTPLGKDVLVLVRLDGSEGLSELFEYRIECLSETEDIAFDQAIGQQCSIKIKMFGKEREFHGILVEAQWLGTKSEYFSYRIVLRPWLWLLSRTSDCRIFQDKKAPDIIEEVFKERAFNDYKFELTESWYPQLEYCVQYRETDFNFVCRLMEQHGIYYFFKHEDGKHTLVLADSRSSLKPVKDLATIPYVHQSATERNDQQFIYEWVSERAFRTGKIELNDYNYLKSNSQLLGDAKGSESYTHSDMEFYDYPGHYKEKGEGDRYAKVRLEAEQALDHRRVANGNAVNLYPGGLTTLQRHPNSAQNIEYVVVRARHSFEDEAYRSGPPGGDGYYGSYEFQPSDRPFRAPIVTRKPVINGIQTAKVVTKEPDSSEEIDVENLGEIYVRFFWDRKKKRSCRLRVAQVWSGKGWGGQIIPRVGQEVVVEFLEGDPDRPLVTGTVYNDQHDLPYELPGDKTISGLKSDSTKNGGGGYNEWHFEDKDGSEQIVIHAQKDLNVTVLNAENRTIGEDFVGGVSRQTTLKNGDDKLDVATGSQQISIAMNRSIQAGASISTTAGLNISITATLGITLTVGLSSIVITPANITIESPTVTILSEGPTLIAGTPVITT
jgi:type VI secretion system secreted protein VgrG